MKMNLQIICFALLCFGVYSQKTVVTSVQDFYWRDYIHGTVPIDAFEGKPGIFIGQAAYINGIVPVVIYPYRNAAIAIDITKKDVKNNIKILCAYDKNKFYWQKVDFGKNDITQMFNAVKGGYHEDEDLFVGAVWHDGDWKIGKVKDLVRDNEKGLYIWDNHGNQARVTVFDLLKYNSTATSVINFP